MIEFWEQSDRGKISPDINKIYELLSVEGFRGLQNIDKTEVYKISGQFVEKVPVVAVIAYFRNMIINTKSDYYKKFKNADPVFFELLWEAFTKFRLARIFDNTNFVNFETLEITFKRHTRNSAFYYFKNCFVEVTKTAITKHAYSKLYGYIYKKNIIEHNFETVNNTDAIGAKTTYSGGWSFSDFLKKLSHKSTFDSDLRTNVIAYDSKKFEYLQSLIGFLIHDYKQQGDTDFAPIFCDDEGGGSGKGIIIQAIAKLAKTCSIDAKRIKLFDPINMTKETRVKVYSDVTANYPLENAYNEITEFGSIMYKNGHEEIIDYKDSWKVAITSNFIIRGNKDSDKRRQRVFDVHPFFNADKTPKQHYGGAMFFSDGWTNDDWNFFYTTMFQCVQQWLQCDYNVQYSNDEYNARKLEESFPNEFRSYMDSIPTGWHNTATLYQNFKDTAGNSPFVKKANSTFFGRLATSYLSEMKIPYNKNTNRTEIFINKDAAIKVNVGASKDKDLPF